MDPKYAFLGLIARAQAYSYGERMMQEIRKGQVYVVLLADNASERSQKQIRDKCLTYHIKLITHVPSEVLLQYFVKPVIAIGINDKHMAQKVVKEMRCE